MRASTFALAVIGCLLSSAAFAHAHLRAETPAANASVQAPTALTLTSIASSSLSLTSNSVRTPAATLPSSHRPAIDEASIQISRETRLPFLTC
jgi:methionine-rich copper-binding protein CopC